MITITVGQGWRRSLRTGSVAIYEVAQSDALGIKPTQVKCECCAKMRNGI